MICSQGQSLWLCHASMRGSDPLQDWLPGEHTGWMAQAACRSSWYNHLHCCHSHTHSHMVAADRSMVVGHVPTVHRCSFVCTYHIDMIVHTPAFLWVGKHSRHLDLHHATRVKLASFFSETFFFIFFNWNFSHGKIRTRWDSNSALQECGTHTPLVTQ